MFDRSAIPLGVAVTLHLEDGSERILTVEMLLAAPQKDPTSKNSPTHERGAPLSTTLIPWLTHGRG